MKVTLMGPDDLGRWYLADHHGNSFPFVERHEDHPQAAELFNPDKLPALHDPFAGGGSIPLEATKIRLHYNLLLCL